MTHPESPHQSNHQSNHQTVLVTGATGSVGRQIVAELLRRGHTVRALTRNPATAEFPDGVEVVRGDLTDPASLVPALEGVSGVHLITFGGALFAPLETGGEIVGLARKAGVRRITVLHGGGPSPLEDAVRASEVAWTVVMPVEFMSNALEWAESIRSDNEVQEPFVGRLSAMVHETDIGAVTAVALTEDGHGGKDYLITGPQALTVQDKVNILAAARGREIGLVELSEEQARERWEASGHPQDVIDFLIMVYRDTPPEGKTVLNTVEQVTGRPARTFAEWAQEHADAFCA
ncbi:NAD(P)H-binding protein [Streptomyces sp. NBC_01142]|uniref:NmrA family NAD(P)-binding protein n=1 Tax=Streptomyces sp. NBC_01142 TaxID=2975865 RepID=UPI002252563D|nr:NAD(P)H-binding protein [Streptomyces sp. NBC_01142]MCX4824665.1 NAD(P)H-binding protein [Streptomyces sp. NBC_01142]